MNTNNNLAHGFRRLIHIGSASLAWLYYAYGANLAQNLQMTTQQLLWWIMVVLLGVEALRLLGGWQIFGQRTYEKRHISAFTWGGVSMVLVLLYAPSKGYALAIITSYALVDPLLGELRRTKLAVFWIVLLGIATVTSIWLLGSIFYQLPFWLAPIMAVITVAVEWPSLSWIDDNALLQLLPLLVIKILF